MPLTFKRGDMFASGADTLVNAVNCQGKMGAGVALEFAKRFPKMYEAYKLNCELRELKPGKIQIFEEKGRTIVNLPTKNEVYRGSEMRWVCDGLRALRDWLKYESQNTGRIKLVAIPALGCGHGGLHWETVKEVVYSYLHDLPQQIWVYEPFEEEILVNFEE